MLHATLTSSRFLHDVVTVLWRISVGTRKSEPPWARSGCTPRSNRRCRRTKATLSYSNLRVGMYCRCKLESIATDDVAYLLMMLSFLTLSRFGVLFLQCAGGTCL